MSSYKLYSNYIYNDYLFNTYYFLYKNLPIEICIMILEDYGIENSKNYVNSHILDPQKDNDPEYNLDYNYPYLYDDFTLYSLLSDE